ncbi:uncharacterized protein LOC117562121 [Gymnodraco acuticeps]|uniref:Uncharacterized protein LOC117562121 n=1 Tax=Gymnodraco acuticeps TaxID=8218 RepID=A0A6P8WEW8_GYMAC|nr:uncharacterized protein LOC117562121 [Gymnodraco acuticeps]
MLRHTKMMAIGCPICNSPYRALSKHLLRNHSVRNLVERRILLLLAKGRINIRLQPCIIAGCEYNGTRLDRHLYRNHVELSRQELHVVLTKLKMKVATKKLHELSLTNPTVAMITSWDVDTVGDDVLSQPPPLSPVIKCDNPDCKEWRMDANRMKAQRDIYAAEVKSLRCMLQQRIKRNRKRMNQRAEDQERVFLRKRSRTESTPKRLSKSKGPSCRKSPIASHTPVSSSSEPASIDTEASSSSPPIHSPWFSGRGRGNRMRDITFPRIMEKYLQGYRDHYEGIDPTVRLQENAVSKISRVKSFLSFMAHGFNRLSDWLFLRDLKRIRGWSRSLIKSSLQVTTSDFYIKNISHFLKYMNETPCKGSRLNQNDMILITREVAAILKSMRKKVFIHQMQVKRDKIEGLPSHKDIMACLTAAKTRIPQLLDVMTSNPTHATRSLLYGYMTLNWSCIYGHRPGVYSNMTNTEVLKAEITGTAFGHLIHVSNHKTANAFGEAQMYLTIEEFGWMKRWLEIKGTLTGTNNRYFLCIAGKNPSRNLATFLRLAWADVGLKGPINFTDLRTVHADNAKRFQDISNRQRVSDFMCHNTATADTFYAKNPSLKEAADIRMLFTESLQAVAAAASGVSEDNLGDIDIHSDRDSSGEEHSPTPYQDSTDTETSDELYKDFNAWRAAKREQSMAEHSPSDTGEERVPASAPTSPDTDNVASDQLVNMQCFVVLSPLVLDELIML